MVRSVPGRWTWLGLLAGPGLITTGVFVLLLPAAPADIGSVPSARPIARATATHPPAAHRSNAPLEVGTRPLRGPLSRETPDRNSARQNGPALRGATGASSPAPPAPVRLRLARLGVSAPVLPVDVGTDGELRVPNDPDVVGWWQGGARPGDGRGSIVIDGHVDSARFGIGVFALLPSLRPGDRVSVEDAAGDLRHYTVTGLRWYPRAELPTHEVFGQDVRERLVLITCGGRFDDDRAEYTHNVVVYAVPAD